MFKGTPGQRLPKKALKIMFASDRSVKMRVVCTSKFVLRMDIGGDTEVRSLGGLRDFAWESK